jgi:hypothetical protein
VDVEDMSDEELAELQEEFRQFRQQMADKESRPRSS